MAVASVGLDEPTGGVEAQVDVLDGRGDTVVVNDARLLTMGDYARSGADLTITGPDGAVVVIEGYFLTDTPPDLAGPDGMVIAGTLAERLAGPRVPGVQIAQAGGDQLAQAAPIGNVEKVNGTVTVQRADGSVVELVQGDAVYEGDIVVTAADGKIGLVFLDGSEFSLGGNGRMVLDEMVYDPASGDGSSSVSLLSGTFSFISGQIAKASPDGATVNTPIATIGIRGTSGTIRFGAEEVGATEQLQVVLIPDPGGTVGEIIITTPGGQVTTLNVPFNGLNFVGGLIQTFTISAEDFVQEYGAAVDYLRSDFGDTLPPQPDQGPGDTNGPNNGQEEGQESGRNDQGFGSDVVRVVLDERGHGIRIDPEIVPERDYERPPRSPNPQDDRDGGFYRDEDEGRVGEEEDDGNEQNLADGDGDGDGDDGGPEPEPEPGQGTIVTGSSGSDILRGSDGADSIFGGAGADTLVASLGDDVLNGGDGPDWVSYSAFTANLSINLSTGTVAKGVGAAMRTARAAAGETGALGTDTLISIENIAGGSGDDTFIGDAGNNTFIGGAGRDTLSHAGQTAAVTVNMMTGVASGAGIGTDSFSGFENIIGGAGDDTFVGDAGNNTIIGGAGRDTVSFAAQTAGVSVNLATGVATGSGVGNDVLRGIETVIGGAGDDAFVGDAGDNAFIGGAGNDTVSYAAQTAGVTVDVAAGVVTGAGIGTDTVSGIEYFIGGSGNDTFIGGAGGNVFVGGAGSDTVSYAGKTGSVAIDLSTGYAGFAQSQSASLGSTSSSHDRLQGIENAIGGSGNDSFIGNAADNTFIGGAGIDSVSYSADTAGVTVNLATGTATGSAIGTDRLIGIENVRGGSGNDVLTGDAGMNSIDGGAGNDTIVYSGGGDYLQGGEGTDTLVFTGSTLSQGNGTFTGFEVIDLRGGAAATLDLSAETVIAATGKASGAVLRVRGNGGDEVTLSGEWTHSGTTTVRGVTYDVYSTSHGGAPLTVQLEQGLYDDGIEPNAAPTLATLKTAYFANMDTNPGWSGLGSIAAGGWAWGTAGGSNDPSTGATGNTWVGFNMTGGNAGEGAPYGGDYPADMPARSVTTGPIAINGAAYVRLDFMRWLGVESASYDHASVQVSINGSTWQTVWANGEASINDSSWTAQSFDLSQWVGGHNRMYVRWTMGPSDSMEQYCGWNIDDVRVLTGAQAMDMPTMPAIPLHPLDAFNKGRLVSDLLGNASDADGDPLGIAVVSAETAHGNWQYSLDAGKTWLPMGEVSASAAVVLGATARIRFSPSDASFTGGDVPLSYRAWDGSDGSLSGATGVNASVGGGSSAFSDGIQTVTVAVSGPNTAPEVAPATVVQTDVQQYGDMAISVVDLDGEGGRGGQGGEGGQGGFVVIPPEGDPIPAGPVSDEDGPFFQGGKEGYAIVGKTGAGTWQYTTDGGQTWKALGSVSETAALVLVGDGETQNQVRFVPSNPKAAGSASLTLKAWDGADYLQNGTRGVDTTASPMNAYSADTFTHTLVISDVPDWIAGTATYNGTAAQWDMGTVPTASHDLNIHSSSGQTVLFNGTALSAKSLALRGTAQMVVSGGMLTTVDSFQTDEGTSLTISGGTLARAPAPSYSGRYAYIRGDLDMYGGTLQSGNSYDQIHFQGDTARFHNGSAGDMTFKGVSFYIDEGSQAELKNTTIHGASAQDAVSTWFSSSLYVRGGMSVAEGTANVLDNLHLTIGDRSDYARSGELVIHANYGTATTLTTGGGNNYGTIRLTSEDINGAATWSGAASYYTLYNRGGLIHAEGAAGTDYSLGLSITHQAHEYDETLTGLIQVDDGVTLYYMSGNTLASAGGADFLVDGELRNSGFMLFTENGTDLGGTGTYVNSGTIGLYANVTVTITDAELVNFGVISAGSGSVIDLDANDDGLHKGTLTNAGHTTDSLNIGGSPGVFTIDGHYGIQGEGTGSVFEIGAAQVGTGYDTLVVTGSMHRAGTIEVTDWGGFVPTAGSSFDIIRYGDASGRFHHAEGLDTWLDQGIGMGVTVDGDGVTLTARAVTQAGTAAGDTLTGTAGRDVLAGFGGDDVLVSNGGNDLLFGGDGHDRFIVSGTAFNHIDGGAGTDTLVVNGSIDLSGLGGELFSSLERISLEGAGAQNLTLDSHIVQSMSGDTDDLIVRGAANDSVTLEGAWSDTGSSTVVDGVSYSIWNDADSLARVLVQDGMTAVSTA